MGDEEGDGEKASLIERKKKEGKEEVELVSVGGQKADFAFKRFSRGSSSSESPQACFQNQSTSAEGAGKALKVDQHGDKMGQKVDPPFERGFLELVKVDFLTGGILQIFHHVQEMESCSELRDGRKKRV